MRVRGWGGGFHSVSKYCTKEWTYQKSKKSSDFDFFCLITKNTKTQIVWIEREDTCCNTENIFYIPRCVWDTMSHIVCLSDVWHIHWNTVGLVFQRRAAVCQPYSRIRLYWVSNQRAPSETWLEGLWSRATAEAVAVSGHQMAPLTETAVILRRSNWVREGPQSVQVLSGGLQWAARGAGGAADHLHPPGGQKRKEICG